MNDRPPADANEPIAIIGIGCRLPGASGPEAFWRLLREGVDAIAPVPEERWDAEALYDPDPSVPGKMNTRWGGFLEDLESFDADHFRISAREAMRMDPQQRIVLEVAWEALEDAGVATSAIAGSLTGVYMGASTYDHGVALASSALDPEPHDGTGSALSVIANRLSYFLDLHGPSMVLDTACSSSLVAAHLACRALRAGETSLALAGGVNAIANPGLAMAFSKAGLMASDGRCKPFDRSADGYVRSEGAGVVILKRLGDALRDRDRVYALICGSAVNQDGRTNGLSAPNRHAQEAMLRAAYAAAGISPAEADYVEAHGTGTAVGDPIEVAALARVLCEGREADRPLRVGSAKSNVGHLEAAAGVTGLIKLALSVHHGELPANIHFQSPNPLLGLERLNMRIQARLERWPERGSAIAGVSSFGFGGTNCHLVLSAQRLEETMPVEPEPECPPVLLAMSARSQAALARRALAWAHEAELHEADDGWLARSAAAGALRSDHHVHRATVVADDARELARAARLVASGGRAAGVCGPRRTATRSPRPVLVFPGQGSQWQGMGERLAARVPTFAQAIERCDKAVARWLGHSLWDARTGLTVEGTAEVQPALFAIQVALAQTWRAWGLEWSAVVGHSMGEIAAAHVAGAISLDDAARIVCERARLLGEISGRGGLALVELDVEDARALVADRELSIAAANGPRATVLSGAPAALAEVIDALAARGVFARHIAVEFPAHSAEVEPLQPRLRAALEGVSPRETLVPLYSTVTGEALPGVELTAEYWGRNLRMPVLFAPAIERLLEAGHRTFVEVAPHPVLARSIAETAAEREHLVVGSLHREQDELRSMLEAAGELHVLGVKLDWRALYPRGAAHQRIPPHGWERRKLALSKQAAAAGAAPAPERSRVHVGRGLLGARVPVHVDQSLRVWRLRTNLGDCPELADHEVDGVAVVPGAYWLSAAAQAALAAGGGGDVLLEHVVFAYPYVPRDADDGGVQLGLRRTNDRTTAFEVASSPQGGRALAHCHGRLRPADRDERPGDGPAPEPIAFGTESVSDEELYAALREVGLGYGEHFRGVTEVRAGVREALARVRRPADLSPLATPLHPAMLDACLHALAVPARALVGDAAMPLPTSVRRLWMRAHGEPLEIVWSHVRLLTIGEREVSAEVTVLDEDGACVCRLEGLHVRFGLSRPVDAPRARIHRVEWRAAAKPRPTSAPGGWLVLADGHGVAGELVHHLTDAGESCALIGPDAPSEELAWERLLDAERERAGGLRGVIDAHALDAATRPLDAARLHEAPARLLRIARALSRCSQDGRRQPRLWTLTSATQAGAPHPVDGALAGAPLWGLARVLDNELPEIACSSMDLDDESQVHALRLASELLRDPEAPRQVVLRGGSAHVPRLSAMPPGGSATRVRDDRAYLLSGGLGTLGLTVARWLVARGARHLCLIGRSAPSAEAVRAVTQLREHAQVHVLAADVADAESLAAVLRAAALDLPVGGVLHMAGVLEDALVANLDERGLRAALAGKAHGAWNLHVLTREQPLEMFVLFSSLAGLLGSPGQAAYAAANAFLDALAVHRAALELPALSIDWGPWGGTGMAVDAGGVERLAARGIPPLQPEHALELLDAAISGGASHVAAAAFDLSTLSRRGAGSAAAELLAEQMPAAADDIRARGALRAMVATRASPAERQRVLVRELAEHVASVLRTETEHVDVTLPLMEMGLESLMAMELRDRLEVELDARLSAALLFAHPTVELLAQGLLELLELADAGRPRAEGAPTRKREGSRTTANGAIDPSQLDDGELAALVSAELQLHGELTGG